MMKNGGRMMTAIEELVTGGWSYLTVEFCAGCDKRFASFVPTNPGDHFHQIMSTNLCDECQDKSNEGIIDINMFSDFEEVNRHREKFGLTSFTEAYNEFKQDDFDSYLRFAGTFTDFYSKRIDEEQLNESRLKVIIRELEPNAVISDKAHLADLNEWARSLLFGYDLYEDNHAGEERYDHHKELMILRYKELGSSYYS